MSLKITLKLYLLQYLVIFTCPKFSLYSQKLIILISFFIHTIESNLQYNVMKTLQVYSFWLLNKNSHTSKMALSVLLMDFENPRFHYVFNDDILSSPVVKIILQQFPVSLASWLIGSFFLLGTHHVLAFFFFFLVTEDTKTNETIYCTQELYSLGGR